MLASNNYNLKKGTPFFKV